MSPRRDLDRLADMRDALADIRTLTTDGRQAFETDRSAQQAVAYNLAVLGEAARTLSPELLERHAEVPWRDVIECDTGDTVVFGDALLIGAEQVRE